MTTPTVCGTGTLTAPSVSPSRSALVAVAADTRAVPVLRRTVRQTAHCWGLPAPVVDALMLISSELVTNVILHSGSPDVQLLLTADQQHVALHIRDHGTWHEPDRKPGELPTGGRGLDLVRACADLQLDPGPSGTTATARLALNPPGSPAL